jgi:hypothetical protein
MATYSNIGIKLITTGDESGTWGTSTNTNFSDVLDEAIAGAVTYNISSDADFTLTVSDGTSSDARHAVIKFTSTTLTATRVCTFAPNDLQKTWVVINSTTGGQSLTFKQGSAGGTVTVPNGESAIIYSDGGGSSAGAVTRVLDSFTNTKITTGTLNATTLDLTNLEVTNIKAKDGTAALTIADSTGKVTVSTELAVDNLNLSGNAITSTDTNGNIDLTPNGTGEVNITKVDIDSGAIDGTPIGASSASTGAFTTLSASSTVSGTGFSTYLASPPAIGSTAANTGAFTTLTTSSTVTLNGGTANGVLYLNGSKVATSGSALTFDGTTFQLSRSSGDIILNDTSGSTSIRFLTTGGINYLQTGGSTSGTYAPLAFTNRGGTAEYMRLTDTGLGIGTTSPATKLQVEAAAARCDTRISRNQSSGEIGTLQFAALDSGSAAQVYTQIISGITSATAGAEQGYLAFETVNAGAVAERIRLDTSGNLLVGATTNSLNARLKVAGATRTCTFFDLAAPAGENWVIDSTNTTGSTDVLGIYASGATGLYIKDTGDVGIGTTSPAALASGNITLDIAATTARSANIWLHGNNTSGTSAGFQIQSGSDSTAYLWNNANTAMIFATNNTERARITSGGYFKASNDGTYSSSTLGYHELSSNGSLQTVVVRNTIASGYLDAMMQMSFTGYSPNTTTSWFLYCNDTTAQRAAIRSNGGLANYQANNVDLSDARTKNSITPAASMWDKVAALEIVAYKYNDQTHDDVNLGVIAQQVESVEPVWVDSDGWGDEKEGEEPLKTVYTKDITFAAIKALQEAMARIEQLEAKVAVLENK